MAIGGGGGTYTFNINFNMSYICNCKKFGLGWNCSFYYCHYAFQKWEQIVKKYQAP